MRRTEQVKRNGLSLEEAIIVSCWTTWLVCPVSVFHLSWFMMTPLPLFVLSCLAHLLLLSSAEEEHHPRCAPFQCGTLGEFRFPFRNNTNPECGLYTVNCSMRPPKVQLKKGGHWFEIYHLSPFGDSIVLVSKEPPEPFARSSCESKESFALPSPSAISNLSTSSVLTVFNCSKSLPHITPPRDVHHNSCGHYDMYYTLSNNSFPAFRQCSMIQLPGYIDQPPGGHNVSSLHDFTLDVRLKQDCYTCHRKKSHCQIRSGKDKTYCFNTEKKGPRNLGLNLELKLGLGTFSGIVVLLLLFFYRRIFYFACHIWKKQSLADKNMEAFLKNYLSLQARRYSYLDVKKMTNSFKEKLGHGGFGSVYKGKLHDGVLVAVKVLDESKTNGEDFINEVAAISRTSHVNVVSLLGFCFEGAKRALVYEFMPNGSLEKFVFDENIVEKSHQLDWETLYHISLGIARGLEYLHRGCNTRILHFDIKPHNILLDADFVPKISDFGLARICTRKESLVSMLGPRGTIGYIAPEVVSRSFGGISHKSDVYSYGMMVLEMVGGRKNVNIRVENTSEIYFPHWIYKRIELDEELGLERITHEGDRVKVRKMIIVSLWCIQTNPANRPSMSQAIEMLEGSLDSLQVPPKPFLYSSPGSPSASFSCTSEL